MRYIKTTNNYVEFIEADDSQNILSVRGFQFGELYFQIKNKKVTFYLNDQENPWRNDVWTINIPFELDGELYEDEDSAAAALEAIINDSFQEQLDELKEDLADEVTRSTAKDAEHDALISALTEDLEALAEDLEDEIERSTAEDERLDQKIDDEIADRISGDTYLEGLINAETARAEGAESAITAALNAEISRSTAKDNEHDALISGLTSDLADEIARSMAKDAEHDAEISGLTADLNNEITRAMSAETILHDEILAEKNRALAAESALTNALADEVSRSTAKDNEHDALISGLTANLNSEIVRAMSAETVLHNEILAETTRALAAEDALVTALNNEVSRSTSKDASHDALISGLTTSLQNEINRATGAENSLRNDLNSEISARTSSDNSQNQRLTALEVGKADANNVYTKAESDAKYATKDFVSGLTDNFYTKGQTNELLAEKADKANAVSTALYNSQNKSIDFKNIDGNVIASVDARDFIKDGMVDTVSISGNNLVITFNTDAGKEDIVVPLTNIFDPTNYYDKTSIDNIVSGLNNSIDTKLDASAYTPTDLSQYWTSAQTTAYVSGYTYDKATIDEKVAQGGTFDPTQYYTKSDVDSRLSGKTNEADFSAHTANTTVHVTQSEKNTWNAKSDFSGNYNDLTNKPTIPTVPTNVSSFINDVPYVSSAGMSAYTYDKNTIDEKIAQGGGSGVTSGEVQTMINNSLSGYQVSLSAGTNIQINNNVISATDTKYTAGDGISISNQNVISTVTKFWCGTQAQYDAIVNKDSNTVYMIHE